MRLKEAKSINNGIIFYSEHNEGYVVLATIDDQNITTKYLLKEIAEKEIKDANAQSEMEGEFTAKITFLMLIPMFVIMYHYSKLQNILELKNIVEFLQENLIAIFLSIIIASILSSLFTSLVYKKSRRSYKFHSAEHMVSNAYNKLNRVPTIDEITKYSRFHNECGTNILILILFISIATFILYFDIIDFYLYAKIVFASLIAYLVGFFNLFQFFVTEIPTQSELLVAIAGMNFWIENEKEDLNN